MFLLGFVLPIVYLDVRSMRSIGYFYTKLGYAIFVGFPFNVVEI